MFDVLVMGTELVQGVVPLILQKTQEFNRETILVKVQGNTS